MKLIQILLISALSINITACGLKKPLINPDKTYPNEPDCQCDNNNNQ